MMIRLILDEAADDCVRECMKISCAANIGTVIQEALTVYRSVLKAEEALTVAVDMLAKLGMDEPDIEVKDVSYDEPRTV